MTTRFAIVGYGMIADAHATAIQSSGDARLVAVADPAPEAQRAARERWGCSAFESVDRMLDEVKVDAACVCSPPALHRPLAELLLEAGVHVLCEKPIAVTVQDARAMVGLAERRRLVLAVSSKFRFVPDLLEARHRIDAGAIGRPIFGEVTFCARTPVAKRWNLRPELAGGGVVMDNGPHAYDVLTVVLGRPPIVTSALFAARTTTADVEDTAEVVFRTDTSVIGRIALSWTYFTKDLDYVVIHGENGTVRVGWKGGCLRAHGEADWTPFGSGYRKTDAFRDQLGAFIGSVRDGEGKTPAEAIRALEFVERVYEAERCGRTGSSMDSRESFSGVTPR